MILSSKLLWIGQHFLVISGAGILIRALVVAPIESDEKDPDPLFLVTNLRKPQTSIQRYAETFHIEEWFKDFKHQLGIARLQTRNLMRVRRLVLVSSVAYGIAMLVGNMPAGYILYKMH